jgi:hypothetical protein
MRLQLEQYVPKGTEPISIPSINALNYDTLIPLFTLKVNLICTCANLTTKHAMIAPCPIRTE